MTDYISMLRETFYIIKQPVLLPIYNWTS